MTLWYDTHLKVLVHVRAWCGYALFTFVCHCDVAIHAWKRSHRRRPRRFVAGDFGWYRQLFGFNDYPDSKVHEASLGPTWVLSAPDGPMNLAIWVCKIHTFHVPSEMIWPRFGARSRGWSRHEAITGRGPNRPWWRGQPRLQVPNRG